MAALSGAQKRLLQYAGKRPQPIEKTCRTALRLVDLGLAEWRQAKLGVGLTAITVNQIEITATGRIALAKMEGR